MDSRELVKEVKLDTVSFSYDNLEILGVFGNRIFVKGLVFKHSDFKMEVGVQYNMADLPSGDPEECVLIIKKPLFKKTLDMWLEEKKGVCEAYGEFCGAMGSLSSEDYNEVPKENRCHIMDEEKIKDFDDKSDWSAENIYKFVRTFQINSFDECVDMEHG